MLQRIEGEIGKANPVQRLAIVAPVFANISEQNGLRGFSLCSSTKVQAQWQLYCLIHNIEKLKNYGNLSNLLKTTSHARASLNAARKCALTPFNICFFDTFAFPGLLRLCYSKVP
jgi:hypothetical protein